MRVGVVGGGYWGSKHIRVLHHLPEVARVVLVEPNRDRRETLQRVFPTLIGVTHLSEALPQLDAVVIATPPSTHARLALQAITSGVHVLVEKPMTTSTADARRLVTAAERARVVLMVGHTFEYNPAVWRLREAIEIGELGELHYIDTARLSLGLYQSDVNVLWDLVPHDLSIMNYVLKSTPTTVQAVGSKHAHAVLEDVAYLRFEYEDVGVTAHSHVSWLDPCKVRRVTIVGSQRMIVYNDLSAEEKIRIYDRGVNRPPSSEDAYELPMSYRYGSVVLPYIEMREPLQIQDSHFLACIVEGRMPQSSGENGAAIVRLLEAADRSMREQRPVRLVEEDLLDAAIGA